MTFNFIISRLLISFVETKEELWKGYFYAVLMFAAASVQTLVLAQYFNRMLFVGLRIRTALISAIYRKVRMCCNSFFFFCLGPVCLRSGLKHRSLMAYCATLKCHSAQIQYPCVSYKETEVLN